MSVCKHESPSLRFVALLLYYLFCRSCGMSKLAPIEVLDANTSESDVLWMIAM